MLLPYHPRGTLLLSFFLKENFSSSFLFFLKGFAPESGFHRNATIAREMNPVTPFPPLLVEAVHAEVL